MILLSLFCLFEYNHYLIEAINKVRSNSIVGMPTDMILEYTTIENIPYSVKLMAFYFGFFVAAEAAFIIMAVKEYLQDILGFSDKELILPK
jgi:hypothetical protein